MPNRQEGERIMGNVFVVGIAGGSASGKTTIADQIQQYFGDQIEVIRHDSYYLPHNDMTYEERTHLNYDHPSSFDTGRLYDKVFVDTDADERIMRRISRDTVERGRSIDSVITQYRETVKPMHDQFVEPSKHTADVIIPWGGENTVGFALLIAYLKTKIQK